jgi:hypothetical protein
MNFGIEAGFDKENMRLLRNSILGVFVLTGIAVGLTPTAVLADNAAPIRGTFAVSYMYPAKAPAGAVDYCASEGTPGGLPVEAQGVGSVSRLGSLFLAVKKCLTFPGGSVGTYTGTFKMTAGNGDTLNGRYAGTQDFSLTDENGYGPFQGTLTITGGTGKFRHTTSGVLSFTAVASPTSVGVNAPTVNGMAFYLVRGRMLSRDDD